MKNVRLPKLYIHALSRNQANEDIPIAPKVMKIPMLKPRIRHIPQDVVASKWAPMSEKAREEVFNVLTVAERPVLMTFKREKQKAEAQEGLRMVMRKYDDTFREWGFDMFICNMANLIVDRLRVSLPRIPVPPMGRDMALSYERLIDRNVS